jgi:hypothetical protein
MDLKKVFHDMWTAFFQIFLSYPKIFNRSLPFISPNLNVDTPFPAPTYIFQIPPISSFVILLALKYQTIVTNSKVVQVLAFSNQETLK